MSEQTKMRHVIVGYQPGQLMAMPPDSVSGERIYPKAVAPTTERTARLANERADRWQQRYDALRVAVEALADEMGAAYTFDQWDSLCIRLRAALADQGGRS